MKLKEACFVKAARLKISGGHAGSEEWNVPMAEADGIAFQCPVCSDGHMLLVWFRGRVPDLYFPGWKSEGPKGWIPSGSSIDNVSLTPSVDCATNYPGCWHGHVTNGEYAP
jgi:hypothetical protein